MNANKLFERYATALEYPEYKIELMTLIEFKHALTEYRESIIKEIDELITFIDTDKAIWDTSELLQELKQKLEQ